MKYWVESILSIMGAVILLSWTGQSAPLHVLQDNEVPFSVTYDYQIDLNISEAMPSIESAIDQLRNATLSTLENLVDNKDDPPFRTVAFETVVIGPCESESDLCSSVQSTLMFMVRDSIEDLVIEYTTLGEVQSFLRSFNQDHENIFVSFRGPYVVRTNIAILLENVNGHMSEVEIAIFEETLLSIVGPPLLLREPAITVRSATVFFQQLTEHTRRRLQTGNSNVIGVHVTGQCNDCTSSQFIVGDAIDVSAGNFQRTLKSNSQAAGTDYFDDVTTSVAMLGASPGISDESVDFFAPPNNSFPYWVLIVLAVSVFIITSSACCAACRSRKERTQAKNHLIGRSLIADESQDPMTNSQDTDQPVTYTSKMSKGRELEVMPHLRQQMRERIARQGASA